MWSWQIGKKMLISILTLMILIVYYSTYRHPYDLKLALTHHFYHKTLYNQFTPISGFNNTILETNKSQNTSIKPQNAHTLTNEFTHVLNISNIPVNIQHFQLIQLKPNHQKCTKNNQNLQNSFLLINTNTKTIGLKYMKLLKSLLNQKYPTQNNGKQGKCRNFKIFLLRQKKILIMDSQQSTSQYTQQISKAVKTVSEKTINKLTILTTQQGSALLLRFFIDMIDTGDFKSNFYRKIDKILLINMYNGDIINRSPISDYLNQIKKQIISSKQKLKIFNSLNFIIINTQQRQYRLLGKINNQNKKYLSDKSQFQKIDDKQNEEYQKQLRLKSMISDEYFVFLKNKHWVLSNQNGIQLLERTQRQQTSKTNMNNGVSKNSLISIDYISLQNSTILHTMEMSNIHASFLSEDYFHYVPFLQLIADFIIENSHSSMNLKGVQYYFRYRETLNKTRMQKLSQIDINSCVLYNINTTEPTLWTNNKNCFKLNLTTLVKNYAALIYSENGQFQIYTESLNKIAPYDQQLNKSLYLFEKLQYPVIIYNPKNIKIIISVGEIFSPSNPLTKIFTHSQISYLNQIQPNSFQQNNPNKKFIVRTCQSGNLLVFPDNFPIGKISRQFLLKESHQFCYNEVNFYHEFMDKLNQNWTILRNIIIIILFKRSFLKIKYPLRDFIVTFLSISLLLYYTQLTGYHNILIMFTVYIIDQAMQLVFQLGDYIQIDRNKVFLSMTILFIVSHICQSFQFLSYNYWKMFLIFLVFFINKDNGYILAVKLYYLQDSILYGHQDFFQIIQLALFMYLTRTIKNKKLIFYDSVWWVTKFSLLLGLAFFIIFSPETDSIHSVFNFYINTKIILSFLRILLLYDGEKGQIQEGNKQ